MEKFPVERKDLIKKLKEELGCNNFVAETEATRLEQLTPEVFPLVKAWYNGEFIEYSIGELNISDIMKKTNGTYIDAIAWMSLFIKHPDSIEDYKAMKFDRR